MTKLEHAMRCGPDADLVILMSWRDDEEPSRAEELLVFESKRVFGKQRDPKIKKRTVMNSILKAGTLQLFNDFYEYPGGPWILPGPVSTVP